MTLPRIVMSRHQFGGDGKKAPPTWRERVKALRFVPKLLRMVWETNRLLTIAMGALRLVRGFVPIASLYVGKLIIDRVVALRATGGSWRSLMGLIWMTRVIIGMGWLPLERTIFGIR